ncbi:MAG: transglutaminase-like domain-containing protein [Clostridiales bacterium]|jgi:hypothetical protein|nr:transglutaminase-like domain-containing protein [Clostridiales bacterium]
MRLFKVLAAVVIALSMTADGIGPARAASIPIDPHGDNAPKLNFERLAATAGEMPGTYTVPEPSAPGTEVYEQNIGILDYSNASDGYITLKYAGTTANMLGIVLIDPSGGRTQFTQMKADGNFAILPLVGGDGTYTIQFVEILDSSGKSLLILQTEVAVTLADELSPFLIPNIEIDYRYAPDTVAGGALLTAASTTGLEKIAALYNYVSDNFTYNYDLADLIAAGALQTYSPNLDQVLAAKTGICYDMASVLVAMCRSQGIPCKLVKGVTTQAPYHAWVSVYSEEVGWINDIVSIDDPGWKMMDPTFAASGGDEGEAYSMVATNYAPQKYY